MAAEVPAKDVLCEAMEYLSKLGSNLRTRSENLRDKKIRRDKLNNVLAVQKAASKVLLICELSKKSLENVETGVRKVLTIIDTSQSTSRDGGKTSNENKDAENKSKYYYIEYKSRKLRIKKRISLKHYTSVRVLAKSMPKSMIDKYPVHYDCKLYRMRKREKRIQKQNSECSNVNEVQEDSTCAQGVEDLGICEKEQGNDMSIISIPDSPTDKASVYKSVDETKRDENQENDMSIITIPDISKSNSAGIEKKYDESDKNADKKTRRKSSEKSKERSHSRDSDQSEKRKQAKEIEEKKDNAERSSKLLDSKKQDKYCTQKRSRSSDASTVEQREISEASTKSDKSEKEKKKFKKVRVIEDSSDDEKKADEENIDTTLSKNKESDVSCHEPEPKKLKLSFFNVTQNKSTNEVVLDVSDDEKHDAKDKEQNNDTENDSTIKPLIKCVSLSKLLKPDVLVKENIKKPHSKPKITLIMKDKETEAEKHKKSEKLARKVREEEEYWVQKRKEVSSFKSKNFVINVTRLPEFSIDYLNKLSLKKITQSGVTICEIIDENAVAELKENHKTAKSKNNENNVKKTDSDKAKIDSRLSCNNTDDDNELIAEVSIIKDSLLNGSDSDCDALEEDKEKSAKKDSDTVMNALLNDSDTENKDSGEESQSISKKQKSEADTVPTEVQNAKKALCNNSDSESDKNELEPGTADNEKVNNAHLNNSDSENKAESDTAKSDAAEPEKTLLNHSNSESENITAKLVLEADSESESGKVETVAAKSKTDGSHNEEDEKNEKEKDPDDVLRQETDGNILESNKNEKTPEKESSPGLSDDKTKTPLSQRMTPQSKKKRMREQIYAKKMLMTYSSSSDTEDEQLKEALKEIKNSLLHGSDEENSSKKQEKKQSRDSSPTSSPEDIIKKVKKKITYDSDTAKEKGVKHKRKKHRKRLDSEESTKNGNSDNSKSSSSKMVRSKSKPGNSSSQNSDAQDSNDKDIDGLTNLHTLNKTKTRRRRSSAEKSDQSSGANTRSRRSKIKPTGLISAEVLKAESSSDLSASDEDKLNEDDDLPPVTIPSFNGVEHLVKEDLLGESDSSLSQDEAANKDDSDDEDKLNARRRKANAMISSDSEVGSSRKKDADVKLSDFEDSDDSELTKRSKRKKKAVDSDASVGSTSSNEGGKKKRRRIKSLKDSDMSGSESETEGKNKHGRKNIRKVMGKNQLEEATKKAAREEKERMARIAERQKMYNNLEFDESGKPDEVVLDKVILDFDPETKEPLIEVDRGLVKKLKPHQANGIKFMWNACFESVKRIKKDKGSGCILAHCMGLGKTLQVVSLTHTLLTHSDLTKVNRVLVVCPLSTVLNWVNEFTMWLKYTETDYEVDVYELSRYKQNSERSFQLSQWFEHGGVCVLGYEMFRNLSADNSKKFKKKMLKNFQEALVDPGPDLVVCDEGHLLKNEKTSLSQSMNRIKTLRRIVLTGTPLQNNLKEYYCMVTFVKPNLLGKYNEYLNRFVNPITNGQYTDSTEFDIKIMKRRSHVLHKMLDGAVQRRDYGVLAPFLPPKHEYVVFITLSEVQTKLYQHYLDNFSRRPLPGKSSGFLFPDFQSLQRIWTHPLVLKYNSERYEILQQKKRDKEEEDSEGSLVDFIDDDSTPDESSSEDLTDDSSDLSDDSRKKSKKKKAAKKNKGKDKEKDKDFKGEGGSKPRRGTRANPIELDDDDERVEDDIVEAKNENPTDWWIKLVEDEEVEDMRNSHKLVLLFEILRQCDTIGDKLLVFSQSLYSLDLIEHFLGKVDEATQEGRVDEKLGGHVGSWSPGVDYFRLDGSTSCENRSIWCKNFNREDNPRARLFLISTRAGGLGINLVAANRVVIFDVSWNPSHDVQSIFRVYRFGQKKPCYVYRFLAMGTMEEKIYERQVTKQAISKRVIDEQQIDRHYAENDLAELYKFEPTPPMPRAIPPLPKDRLFAEMLREHEKQIYKYHEHDSLLENKEEETLSEEERKAAWEDFENEKNRPPPAPFANPWPMHNGMVSTSLLVQQQQLAYAALAAMLRKDMPNLNDNQLRDMLPLIYNANPQLMQKMSEIYKYPQPGMMNPAMMNPGIMNAASGAGGMSAMSGASGLQYEPPWQRQQQQQQQMRLQQLMQQQNQMGAKFYAGGLGSRDPVAMALQQQRAREIMLSNSGAAAGAAAAAMGRPRGRPPMQPRAPTQGQGDVVNLDSD